MPRLSQQTQTEMTALLAQADTITILDTFEPNVGGGELLFRSKKHQILFLGGNKSGKTYQCLIKLGLRTTPEIDKYGNKTGWLKDPYLRRRIPNRKLEAWISTYSKPVQKETIQPTFDLVFSPYVGENIYAETGIYLHANTELANIHFKWQEAKKKSYEGANVDYIDFDEPHAEDIYNEMISRFAKTNGYIWGGATLVVNPDDPDALKKLKYIDWMIENLIKPWEDDPDNRPQLDVIYASIEENPHVNAEFQIEMWAGMSEQERLTRQTGRYYRFIGQSCFDRNMLVEIDEYLRKHPEDSVPEYGYLEYDDTEDDEWAVVFRPKPIQEFPDSPQGDFVIKIWEHPIRDERFISPEYYMGGDVAQGVVGGDYTSIYVKRADTGCIVAALHGHLSEIELARQLNLLGMYYCTPMNEPAMLALECNPAGFGNTVLSYLIHGHAELGIAKYGLTRLYHRPLPANLEKGLLIIGNEPGWYTSNRNRNFLLTAMRKNIVEAYEAVTAEEPRQCPIPDRGIIKEGINFILNKNGKYEATPGVSNDDRLFSLAILDKCIEQYHRTRIVKAKKAVNDDIWYSDDDGIVLNLEAEHRAKKKRKPKRMVY